MMKCAHCKERDVDIAHVKVCAYEEEQAKAELEAEARNERWFEERGGPVEDDTRERELWAMEDLARETAAIQQREREDDERAYAAKAARDVDLLGALERSVREVRELELDEEERAAARLDQMTGAVSRDMASPKQVRYAMDLLDQHEWPDVLTQSDIEGMERRQVTKLINGLKESPRKNLPDTSDWSRFKTIPQGRYCLEGDDGVLRFFQVDRPDKGRWNGYIFLKELYGAPGDYRKEPRRGKAGAAILEQIAKDPREASLRYGMESKVCGVCHSPLTNEDSLARGIGPVCAGKRGW